MSGSRFRQGKIHMPVTNILDLEKNSPYVLVDRANKAYDVFFSGLYFNGVAQFHTSKGEPISIAYPVEDSPEYYAEHFTCYGEEELDKEFVFNSQAILGLGQIIHWMEGKTFSKVVRKDDSVVFIQQNPSFSVVLKHVQECCESVYLEDVVGDLADLENTALLQVKETKGVYQGVGPAYFYDFRTLKGNVTLRFVHEHNSNWAYSARASFEVQSPLKNH